MRTSEHDVTALLKAWEGGDKSAFDELAYRVYAELHRLARFYMANERTTHTLETRALINEAVMHLIDLHSIRWQDRDHFLCMAARMMRRVLVDYARSRNYQKRGAGAHRVALSRAAVVAARRSDDFLALDEALERLEQIDPRKLQVVELRFFGGFSAEQIAKLLNVSVITVQREWRFAKAWLDREISNRQ